MEHYKTGRRWPSFSQKKKGRRESASVAVAMMDGEYERQVIMMEQNFEIKSESRKPVNKVRVCMCPAVTVTPRQVVRPDSYVMNGECIHKPDSRIWQPEDAGQSLFQCVIGTESEISVKRLREELGDRKSVV